MFSSCVQRLSSPAPPPSATEIRSLSLQIDVYRDGFTPANALQLVKEYDVVIDASDNAPTRYLISDACCVLSKPLVSGAAIGTDGQLNVYCHNDGKDLLYHDIPPPSFPS